MKRHFQPVRTVLLLAVMTIVGAIGGHFARSYLSAQRESDVGSVGASSLARENEVSLAAESPVPPPGKPSMSSDSLERPLDVRADAPVSVIANPATQSAANAVLQGDLMLREGQVSEAVRHYRRQLAEAPTDTAVVHVQYRLALCAEALGRYEEALSTYQTVVKSMQGRLLGELAMLGQARVFAERNEPAAAQQLLRRWLLQSNVTAARSLYVSREAMYLLGIVSAEAGMHPGAARLWEDGGLAQPRTVYEPSNYLPAAIPTDVKQPVEIPLGLSLLHQLRESAPGSSYLQGRLARTSLPRVLQQICEVAKWRLEFTPVAENSIRAHTVRLDFTDQSADVLFDLVLAPLGVGWTFSKGRIHVLAESEMDPKQREEYQRRFAERILFAALLNEPEHRQVPVAYLLLGNLAFRNGDLATARRHFEKILQSFPRSIVDAEAWFNAAKVAAAQGDLPRARQALLGAVDAGRGNPLEPVALLLSGRNELLFDEPLKAVRPLLRAVTLAVDEDVRTRSLLTLASAHLIAGHPEAANVALMDDRRLLQKDAYQDRAAFLGSLARFRSASTPARVERDGRSLISALSHAGASNWNSLHDHLLTVEAFREVGLTEVGIPILESAVQSQNPSPLRTRMQFLLADLLEERGESQRAQIVLTGMTQETSPEVSTRSLLALADLHLRQQQPEQAEQICRDLVKQPLSETQRIAALRLLGGIYAKRGDRQRAVLCFSGVAPQLHEATLGTPDTAPDHTRSSPPSDNPSAAPSPPEGRR